MTESPGETASEPAHIPALDGVRGIAIIMVLLFHFLLSGIVAQGHISTFWIDRTVTRIVGTGWSGVDLFFVLSGFLITRILLRARGGGSYFRSFYARRVLRIFPVYYGLLFFLIVILPLLPGFRGDAGLATLRDHQLAYWTYLVNVRTSLRPFINLGPYSNGHLWSLAVEEQFYLVWPAVVLVLGRRGLGVFCVVCIIAAPVIRYGLLHGAVPQLHNGFAAYTLMPARMDALAFGGLIAVAAGEPGLLRRASRWAMPAGAASALFLAILYLSRGGIPVFDEPVQVYGYSALALTFAAFLTMAVGGPLGLLQTVCGHRVLTFFGRYSYGLYVLHFQIMQWLSHLVRDHSVLHTVWGSNLPAALGFTIFGVAISVAVAWLSWNLYEKHFLKLKRFVPYGRPRQPPLTRSSGSMSSQPQPR